MPPRAEPDAISELDRAELDSVGAARIVARHLWLAGTCYAHTPRDRGRLLNEMLMMPSRRLGGAYVEAVTCAASAFIDVMESYLEGAESVDHDPQVAP